MFDNKIWYSIGYEINTSRKLLQLPSLENQFNFYERYEKYLGKFSSDTVN